MDIDDIFQFSIRICDDRYKVFEKIDERFYLESNCKDGKPNREMYATDYSKVFSFEFDGLPEEEFEKTVELDGKKFICDDIWEEDGFLWGAYVSFKKGFDI